MAYRQMPTNFDPRRNNMKTTGLRGIPDVPTAVARLLEETRQLQDALTRWSQYQLSETQVSDIFVRVGNDFNAAVAAFSVYRIDMSDVIPFPNELRRALEACLSGEPTPQNLNHYLPQVRTIIANLLIGLRNKQDLYRQAVQAHGGRA